MRNQRITKFFTKVLLVITFIIQQKVPECYGLDLFSSLLSQGSNMPLQQLKSMLSSETLEKILQAKGLWPSSESFRGDPVQIQKLLNRLKPMEGRVDPQILQLLSRLSGNSNVELSSPNEEPNTPNPNPRKKFSSKFRRRRPPGFSRRTSLLVTSSTTEIPNQTDGLLQFDRFDPNIRNHRLDWRDQNFTTIDRIEDLMMDETESYPALIPLSPESKEEPQSIPPRSGHWEPTGSQNPEEIPHETPFHREPLRKSSNENNRPIESHHDEDATTEPKFRPSPIDHRAPPKFFEPGQEFFTKTIRKNNNHPFILTPPPTPSEFLFPHHSSPIPMNPMIGPLNSLKKQDRILNTPTLINQRQEGHESTIQDQGIKHSFGLQGQDSSSRINYQRYGRPNYFPVNAYQGQPHHPFAHYRERHTMYSPSHYHHNKYHYLNPNIEEDLHREGQSPGEDKVDGSWSPTFFLLGGLVAASALVAFVLPSILPTVATVGKENEGIGTSESNTDFWDEVKGLYTDLKHIAKGDFTHFDDEPTRRTNSIRKVDNDYSSEEEQVHRPNTVTGVNGTLTTSGDIDLNTSETSEIENISWKHKNTRGRGRIRNDTMSLATPAYFQITSSGTSSTMMPMGMMMPTTTNRNNNSFLTEWAKVQLKIIEP